MKSSFEKHYREKHDNLLQQLAEATDPEAKKKISELKQETEKASCQKSPSPFL